MASFEGCSRSQRPARHDVSDPASKHGPMMLRIVDELIFSLRREGFSIAIPQAVDVARVVALVGFEDRARLRDAVASVVVDRHAERARFDVAFDRFFAPDRARPDELFARLRERGFAVHEVDALRQILVAAAESSGLGDSQGLVALTGTEGELDRLLDAAGIRRALAPMTSAAQAGFFAHRVLERLEMPKLASATRRIRDALREALGEERGSALAAVIAEELERVRRRVRDHVERTAQRRNQGPRGDDGPSRTAFATLSEAELDRVRRAVRRLAERLRGAERVRRRRALRGRIDVRRTLRRSFATGGVPLAPARQVKRRDKPRLWVLCDVSDSVRTTSTFMLEFVYAVQELFAATRSFVFVSELGETTDLFAREPVGRALAEAYGGSVVSSAHDSNYGRVLRSFEARYARSIDRRSTIVILGDGRTNYHADASDVVGRLRDRAGAVLWICPESPSAWGTGDSAMPRYAAACTKVLLARSAEELEIAAREVVARRK